MQSLIFQLQSFLILLLMTVGVLNRKRRSLHVKIMLGAIIWDILLILQIELSRSAIAKASRAVLNPTFLLIHLFFALGSVVLYFFLLFSGRKILKGDNAAHWRKKHKMAGMTAYIFRILTFATSFYAV